MLHRPLRLARCSIVLGALLALLAPLAPAALSSPVAPAAIGIAADPPTVSAVVPLGQTDRQRVAITNTSGEPLTPALYEAYSEPEAALLGEKPVPAALRAVALPRQMPSCGRVTSKDQVALVAPTTSGWPRKLWKMLSTEPSAWR